MISCHFDRRESAGSCNACQDRIEEEIVIVASLNRLTFRVCEKCADQLAAQLQERTQQTQLHQIYERH